jgi:hypothetical protein
MRNTTKNSEITFAAPDTSWLDVRWPNDTPDRANTCQRANVKPKRAQRYIGMRQILLIGSMTMLMTGCITPFSGYSRTRAEARQEYYGDTSYDRSYYSQGPLYVSRPYYRQSRYYADRPYYYND